MHLRLCPRARSSAGSPRVRRMGVIALVLAFFLSQQGCRAEQPWPLWQHYRAHFLEPSGRIVDHTDNDRSTSEGQAYAMFFALVADDRSSFDKLLHWTEDNLAGGDLTARLPAWKWGKSSTGEWKRLDSNSAADADLWLSYVCLEAGRLWKDDRLTRLGTVLADHVARSEVVLAPGVGTVLLPGPQGFHPDAAGYVLNPSYSPPQLLARLRQQQPTGPWSSMASGLPALLTAGAPAGFATDWLRTGTGAAPSPSPDQLAQGKKDAPAIGSYDAIRIYLWLGMADSRTPGVRESLAALHGMATYLAGNALPPLQVQGDGKVLQPEGPVGFSAATIPFLQALKSGLPAHAQQDRLAASVQPETGLYGREAAYYDQNLALFSTGWSEQRFRFDRDGRLKLRWKS